MKTIKLFNKDYQYPTCWQDITIADYQRIHKQIKDYNENDDGLKELLQQINLISSYTKIPVNVLKTEKTSKIIEMVNDLKFLHTDIPSEQIVEFEFNGIKYNVMQSLINQQFQDFISLENLVQQDEILDVMHLIIAVMARKSVDETLDDYDVQARAEQFKSLSITVANNVSVFFYHCVKKYEQLSRLYSNPEGLIQVKAEEVMSYMKNLDGKGLLTRLQVGIIRRYLKYMLPRWKKCLHSTQDKS
jgi:hypothetical protein